MVRSALRALVMALVALAFVAGHSTPALAKPQTNCPVMGGPVDKDVFTDYDGQRVYFCCPGCIDTFKANPMKYLKKMADDGVQLEKTPAPDGHKAGAAAGQCSPDSGACGMQKDVSGDAHKGHDGHGMPGM